MKKIFVTKPYLPPIEEYFEHIKSIWDTNIITNGGPLHNELEKRLAEYLEVQHVTLFANGTLGLLAAVQSLELSGEVITTPFSFVATAHSLMLSGIKPVFVDIEKSTFNIDPDKIERAITEQTTAIMPVHVYGVPCNIEAIEKLAQKHGLKVIYDAAHAFGVRNEAGSILNHGDMSVLSFHATKVFSTIEGGAVVCKSKELKLKLEQIKNFGITGEETVDLVGTNAKMNEFEAAFGLVQLDKINYLLAERKKIYDYYVRELSKIPGVKTPLRSGISHDNYAYFPVLIEKEYAATRDSLYDKLKLNGIFARKYFYPLISEFKAYKDIKQTSKDRLEISHAVANSILCLPIYPGLCEKDLFRIVEIIKDAY